MLLVLFEATIIPGHERKKEAVAYVVSTKLIYETSISFFKGKYQEAIDDAKAAIDLQPTYMKAIERGEKHYHLSGQSKCS